MEWSLITGFPNLRRATQGSYSTLGTPSLSLISGRSEVAAECADLAADPSLTRILL
jgi:hypothetical protein